jgi:hypothetical protein
MSIVAEVNRKIQILLLIFYDLLLFWLSAGFYCTSAGFFTNPALVSGTRFENPLLNLAQTTMFEMYFCC